MADKRKQDSRVYEAETLGLPPLRLVLGEIPAPDPRTPRPRRDAQTQQALEQTVKKLIAHLQEEK